MGALEGGPLMSCVNFRNCHVACPLWLFTFHVASNMLSCPISNLRNAICRVTIFVAMSMSPLLRVDFKKWPFCSVEFRGQWPYYDTTGHQQATVAPWCHMGEVNDMDME